MTNQYQCQFCGGLGSSSINTYKHKWICCDNCGNIVRQQKPKYLFERMPEAFFRILPRGQFFSQSLKRKKEGADFYNYYLDENQKQKITQDGTKWEGEMTKLITQLAKFDINITNKNVLDISGGPGFFAQALSNICKKVVVTEYGEISVLRMKEYLGVNAIKYDFNTDNIDTLLQDVFDVVFIRYAINFCVDIRQMLSSLKKVLSRNSIIYVSFVPPTLGTCLRWQCDDYTYLILYNPETLAKLFAEEGFVAFVKYDEGSYYYLDGLAFKALTPIMIPYRLMNASIHCNRELIQKNLVMIFRRNPDAQW